MLLIPGQTSGFPPSFLAGACIGCSVASHEVGLRGTGTNDSSDRYTNVVYLTPVTADCTGALNYAKIYQPVAETKNVKVCIYNRTTTTPVEADTLVGCSGAIAFDSNADEWKPSGTTATVSGNVTKGNNYWIATIGDANAFHFRYNSAGSGCFYDTVAGSYSSPPANLVGDGSWTTNGEFGNSSVYVTIGK